MQKTAIKKHTGGGSAAALAILPPRVDTRWLQSELDRHGFTQRAAAERLDIDAAAFSLRVNGKRKWQLEEVAELSRMLNAPFLDVVARLGVDPPNVGGTMRISGLVDASGAVSWPQGASSVVPRPPDAGHDCLALRVQANGPLDGLVLYASASIPAAECVGRFCLVELNGESLLRIVKRGTSRAKFDLLARENASTRLRDVEIEEARPIVWARL